MPPTDLLVPFQDKELAKQLGARWDAQRKLWYAPDGADLSALSAWLPQPARMTLRAPYYFIAETDCVCWKCERISGAWGFILPPGHESLTAIEEPPPHLQIDAQIDAWEKSDESSEWVLQDYAAVACHVTHMTETAQRRIVSLAPSYRHDFSVTVQGFYWMNHCTACGMKQGDFTLIEEFDAPLRPIDDFARITLRAIDEPVEFEAGSIGFDPGEFERMTRLESERP